MNDGLTFFKNHEKFGDKVEVLIRDFKPEENKISHIKRAMTYFPNVKEVTWAEGDIGHREDIPMKVLDFNKSRKKLWKYLEKLTVASRVFSLDIHLLDNGTYSNLKYIDIAFHTNRQIDNKHIVMEKLHGSLHCLESAPALETLIIRRAFLSQIEADSLHDCAPKLKELQLLDIDVNWYGQEDMLGMVGDWFKPNNRPAKYLESFSLSIAVSRYVSNVNTKKITQCLKYIDDKYKNLKKLDIRFHPVENAKGVYRDYYPIFFTSDEPADQPSKNPFQRPIKELLSKMPSLQSYTISLYPGPDRSIIQAMDNSNIHLKSIHLDALDDEMDEYYEPLLFSGQAASLQGLVVSAPLIGSKSYSDFYKKTLRISNLLSNLTTLKFTNCPTSKSASKALLYVLKNAENLQHLSIERFRDSTYGSTVKPVHGNHSPDHGGDHNPNHCHHARFEGIDKPFTNKNLKTLTITEFNMNNSMESCKHFSSLFVVIGGICQSLESFTLSGRLIALLPWETGRNSCLKLSFKSKKLKAVKVDMERLEFYQFNEIPEKVGKYWHDYYHQNTEHKNSNSPLSSISLAWKSRLESLDLRYLEPHKRVIPVRTSSRQAIIDAFSQL